MNIVEFLEARLNEDEAVVKATYCCQTHGYTWPNGTNERPDTRTPARVLREVSAKRHVIARIQRRIEEGWGYNDIEHMLVNDLAPLAAVYQDHPDFNHEWLQSI